MCLVQLSRSAPARLQEFPQGKEAGPAPAEISWAIQTQHRGREEVPAASHTSDSSTLIKRIVLQVNSGPQKLDL